MPHPEVLCLTNGMFAENCYILADRDAWCLVEAPTAVPDAVFEPVGATGSVRAH